MDTPSKFIDIDKVFYEKNPAVYKWIPRFVINYLKRITHQDEINEFILTHGHQYAFDFVRAIVEDFKIRISYKGLENVTPTGNYIFAANHPLGGLDAMALLHVLGGKRNDLKFIVNDILLNLKNLEPLFAGVNKISGNSRQMLGAIDKLYGSSDSVLIFPAGLVSRKQNGVIKDLEWKKSFVSKARRYKRNVIPVYISGRNSMFFYNLANIRKSVGIGANIEMLYLPDEMYNYKNKEIGIVIGKPIPCTTFDKSMSDEAWAQYVKERVYELDN
ncbi:MAG: 1-acyl-sn-glycerol-3-phosphate acyltransferase [Bacteroidetes bacterium]|nr:1-acyl-sn-glycerol-3-phosphate acyltransferase [Bacteroidota bacterium]